MGRWSFTEPLKLCAVAAVRVTALQLTDVDAVALELAARVERDAPAGR